MNKLQKILVGVSTGVGMVGIMAVSAFAQTPYTINPTDQAAVAAMSSGATSSFLGLFEANWPTVVTFAITIIGFFFVWRLVVGMLHHK